MWDGTQRPPASCDFSTFGAGIARCRALRALQAAKRGLKAPFWPKSSLFGFNFFGAGQKSAKKGGPVLCGSSALFWQFWFGKPNQNLGVGAKTGPKIGSFWAILGHF